MARNSHFCYTYIIKNHLELTYSPVFDSIILINNDTHMRKIALQNVVWKEGKNFVAWNLNTSVSSFGKTKKEALDCLQEALELHLEDVPISKITKVERPNLVSLVLNYA